MNTSEQQFPEKDIETLSSLEREASRRLLQLITLDYSRAKLRDGEEGGYLQRMVAVTPVETVAFREDSKKQYLADDKSITRKSIYIHVEPTEDSNLWVRRAWVERVGVDGAEEPMYEIDSDRGRRPHEADPSAVEVQDIQDVDILGRLAIEAINHKRTSIKEMNRLSIELRRDYVVVPFES